MIAHLSLATFHYLYTCMFTDAKGLAIAGQWSKFYSYSFNFLNMTNMDVLELQDSDHNYIYLCADIKFWSEGNYRIAIAY
jgi:hypothetical protein